MDGLEHRAQPIPEFTPGAMPRPSDQPGADVREDVPMHIIVVTTTS